MSDSLPPTPSTPPKAGQGPFGVRKDKEWLGRKVEEVLTVSYSCLHSEGCS